MPDLKEDLGILVELTHEIAKKHGDIYISISHCAKQNSSGAVYGNNENNELTWFSYYDEVKL